MEELLVSVVIPVYNREKTITRSISSVLNQSWQNLELIVVDDGSSDDTAAIVTSVSDTRLRLLRHDRNRGASAARNTGIEAATGPYIAFLDSDDIWLPDKLKIQIAVMEKSPENVRATCTGFILCRAGTGNRNIRIPVASGGWFRSFLDVCSVSPGTTLIVRRDVFDRVGLLDTSLKRFEDWDWLFRYLEHYELDCLPQNLASIGAGARPSPETIDEAAVRFFRDSRDRIYKHFGKPGCRRFHASLLLERAVARWAAGRRLGAGCYVLLAALRSPARVFALFKRIARKLVDRDY